MTTSTEQQEGNQAAETPAGNAAAAEAERAKLFQEFASKSAGSATSQGSAENEGAGETGNGAAEGSTSEQTGHTGEGGTASQEQAPGAGTSTATDIWATAPSDLKAAYAEEQRQRTRLEEERTRDRAHTSTLQRQLNELKKAQPAAAAAASGAAAGAAAAETTDVDLSKDPDWQKAKADYPDVIGPVEKIVNSVLGSNKLLRKELAEVKDSTAKLAPTVHQVELDNQGAELDRIAPDFRKVMGQPKFRETFDGWLAEQDQTIKDMVEVNREVVTDARKARTVFNLFRAETKFGLASGQSTSGAAQGAGSGNGSTSSTANPKRQRQLAGSTSVTNRGAGAATAEPTDRESLFKKFSGESADRLRRDGRIVA